MTEEPERKPKHPGGRPKGAAAASNINARRAIADFVDDNVERLTGWLDKIAETNPLAAYNCFMAVVEYHVPKLARQEITGADGEKLSLNIAGLEWMSGKPTIDAEFKEVASLPPPKDENAGG